MNKQARFKVIDGSSSAHCCFTCTVIDTARPISFHGALYQPDGRQAYEAVCECFGRAEAEMIAASLDAARIVPPDFERPWRINEQGVWEVAQERAA
jgi:hypothetical protein